MADLIQVPWDRMAVQVCSCGCENFRLIHKLAICPAMISPTAKPELLARPIYVCNDCGKEFEMPNNNSRAKLTN
jgi:hypothetical protein